MTPDQNRHDLLGADFPTWMIVLFLALSLAAWAGSHWVKDRFAGFLKGWPWLAVRVVLVTVAFWCTWQILGRTFVLETSWSLWFASFVGGAAIEAIWWIYGLEKQLVLPWRGRLLLALRLFATATLLLILVQPVLSRMIDREINREVVVLVDDSESMQLSDKQHAISDQLAIGGLFEPNVMKERPLMDSALVTIGILQANLSQERNAVSGPDGADRTLLETLLENRAEQLIAALDEAEKESKPAIAAIANAAKMKGIDGGSKNLLSDVSRRLNEQFPRHLAEAKKQLEEKDSKGVIQQLKSAGDQLEYALQKLPSASARLDEIYYRNLSGSDREKIDQAAGKPRIEIARKILEKPALEGNTLIGGLEDLYNIRYVRFGHQAAEFDGKTWLAEGGSPTEEELAPAIRRSTDLATALEETLEKVPAESLAGILLLTDGRHNAELPVEDAARQMGAQGSPICVVPIGSRIGPRDASILTVRNPESIYLGDRIAIRSELKLDGLRGQRVNARLIFEGETVAEQTVSVPADQFRTELRFSHTPEEKGIFDYRLEIDPIADELFSDNNRWDFKCAVTDDRTNVLIVDGFPRWEFRYLRNLFYGRDKSVHLQYVLLNPDEIHGRERNEKIEASAARKFGDAEATHLPSDDNEWRKFDAIILGDVPPAAFSSDRWKVLRECVSERGCMLVCIAGPRYMPHAFSNDDFADLLPVQYTPGVSPAGNPNEEFRLELTSSGFSNPILQQSLSRSVNRQIWGSIPPMAWRFQSDRVKEGAEILAYAMADGENGGQDAAFSGDPGDVEAALEQLANQKEFEQDNALLVTQRFGLGRVVMLNFDSTWRFRYGVGDTYHHKFWGQMMRWGTGENLRSGGEYVRLGTDQLSYTPNAPVKVTAKVLDRNREPITGGSVNVSLFKGNTRLQRRQMTYREGSNGIFETELDPISEEGNYKLILDGGPVNRARNESGLDIVQTELLVVNSKSAIELAELTADHDFLAQTAQLSGGAVASIDNAESLLSYFGAAKEVIKERNDVKLWDKWPLLLLFVGFVTTEWILRRRGGLA
tara:strand:- start:480 stop:3632 length:3153 start_codon:yes stop_codon:yes gene_type:complete